LIGLRRCKRFPNLASRSPSLQRSMDCNLQQHDNVISTAKTASRNGDSVDSDVQYLGKSTKQESCNRTNTNNMSRSHLHQKQGTHSTTINVISCFWQESTNNKQPWPLSCSRHYPLSEARLSKVGILKVMELKTERGIASSLIQPQALSWSKYLAHRKFWSADESFTSRLLQRVAICHHVR
jgi:hypothetical protein